MGCVNKSSKSFKSLQEHYNLGENVLELITHTYWKEVGTEDTFPTEIYIQAKTGQIPYYEDSAVIREYWQKNNSTPQKFNTLEEMQTAKKEALKVFPDYAVFTYKDAKDTYTLVVRKPVENIKLSIKDLLDRKTYTQQEVEDYQKISNKLIAELENNGNFAEAKTLKETVLKEIAKEGLSAEDTIENKDAEERTLLVDESIKTGIWNAEALTELDSLIEEYNNGRNEITKVLGRSLSETNRSSEAYAGASIILRRVQSSMSESNEQRTALQEFTEKTKERRLKENAIQQWAQETGWWWNSFAENAFLDDYFISEYGEKIAEGSESIVHLSKDGKYVIKAMSAVVADGDLLPTLQKIELYNQIFIDTPLEILGFGRTRDGNFRIIVKQPFVIGDKISAEEASEALENQLGVTTNKDDYSQTLFDGKVILKDIANPENRGNILKDESGEYFIIDADVRFSDKVQKELYTDIAKETGAIVTEKSSMSPEEVTKKEVRTNLDEFERLANQINALLDSEEITATEVRHTAELVVNSISDIITAIQTEDDYVEKYFPDVNSDLDFKTASRKEIVKAININRLIERTKECFSSRNSEYDDINTILQAQLIVKNWNAIMTMAADVFAQNEGFGIVRDYSNGNFSTTEATDIDYDNFNDYQSTEDVEEKEGDEQEHWQIESRTRDILSSMSELVRQAIRQCYATDKDGNKIISKWGIPERVNPRQAVNSILRWTQGSLTLQDMVERLANKQKANPWIQQLLERLNDNTGNEANFQSQFFNVFAKHFQAYSIVLKEDGKYTAIPVNNHPALTEAVQGITAKYKTGTHSLFTTKGISKEYLGSEETTSSSHAFNLHRGLAELRVILDRINHGEQLNDDMAEEASKNIVGVCKILEYPIEEFMLEDVLNEASIKKMTDALGFIVKALDSTVKAQERDSNYQYDPFKFGGDNSIGSSLRNFLEPITDQLEDTAINAFYDSGKMYQSYVTPSFLTKLMNKFKLEGDKFDDFMQEEYGDSEWFKFKNGDWRNGWLRILATDKDARNLFEHKVELNFNKHNYMRNMNDAEYTLSLITEYFAEAARESDSMVPAWFRIPMMSNKPSSEFIKFYSYRGDTYKGNIVEGLHDIFLQEVSRIQTVRMRNKDKNSAGFIKNFDTNGRKFNFLPFLNVYIEDTKQNKAKRNLLETAAENTKLASLLQKYIIGEKNLTSEERTNLTNLVKKAIRQHMEDRAQTILDEWEKSGVLEAAKKIKGMDEKISIREQVENFLWNDSYAAKNILQLTIGDIAFYKDAEDLQKRLAQLHAPGTRANVDATDYEGNKVSDGTYRTIILKDFDSFKSNIIENISEVFDRKIAAAPEEEKAQWKALKEDLVGEDGKYTKINVTDAQAYSSPTSYRKKALMFGKWSKEAEGIYQDLRNGNYKYTNLEVAFQPLKPFVYSRLQKDMEVAEAPITKMSVPFQAKNAEYLLMMADALIKGEEEKSGKLSRPNLLRAVYRVMEESERINPTKGIDTVQFESAIKSGLQGAMNIHQFLNDTMGGEEAAYTYMMNSIYKEQYSTNKERIYRNYNTETTVHETSFEDYCLQQEVPEHFKNHEQAHGSQIRMIIPSDLDLYKNPNGDKTAEDNKVYYEWTEPDDTVKKLTAPEFRKEYEDTIAENIEESLLELTQELHLDSIDKKERNIALSKILQREILSSPRYGVDLIQACSIDKETGDFRIPKGDPIQAKRIEQLVNSIIKNRVNKQKISGGPIVQVSNFGTSKQLKIRFNARSGGLLMSPEEFTPNDTYKTYDAYKKAEQAGIAYFEVFAPIWDKELVEKFGNEDGSINIEAIEATDPELLRMVSYRIPTEDKYSCAPMKVVGFMPREAGDALMLPYELTEIDDSDFDVDKRYVMRKELPIMKNNRKDVQAFLITKAIESYKKAHNEKIKKENKDNIVEQVKMFMDNPDKMRHSDALMESLYKFYQSIAYTTQPPTSGRTYRNNKIIDMSLAVLTHEKTADKILNPGGFDNIKKMGYMVSAYRNNSDVTWESLQTKSIDELKDLSYTNKDLTWADTQVQFYHQNAAGSNLIGVFAVNKVAHAILEGNDITLDIEEVAETDAFTIAGMTFSGRMDVDNPYDRNGKLIGKTLGSGVSASADTAKEPVLDLMNINMTTVGSLSTMVRLGMPFEDAVLFLSQDIIAKTLNEFNKENLTNYKSLDSIIDKQLAAYKEKYGITDDAYINKQELTKEELIDGLRPSDTLLPAQREDREASDYKTLLAFKRIKRLSEAMRKLTFTTRFNSISSAVGPLIIDNLIIENKMRQFTSMDAESGTHFYTHDGAPVDINDVFRNHPVLAKFAETVQVARELFADMPAGSTAFRNLLNQLPSGLNDKVFGDKKLLDSLSNFYQSYMLIQAGLVKANELKNYVDGFPNWFMKQNFQKEFPDNALINAINLNVSKKTSRPFLQVKITGLDEAEKEVYRNAWIDIHKKNPELSKRLFNYCFFRTGLGFSPKAFMSLVPTYVKERLITELPNRQKVSYCDVFRSLPEVIPSIVIDQWVRNNWNESKLAPIQEDEERKFYYDHNKKTLTVTDEGKVKELKNLPYIRTSRNKETFLWKQVFVQDDSTLGCRVEYIQVKPLGNNGEYVEMSTQDIKEPLHDIGTSSDEIQESDIREESAAETELNSSEDITPSDTQLTKEAEDFLEAMRLQVQGLNKTEARNRFENIKKNPEKFGIFIQNVLKQKGIELSTKEAIEMFKKLC